MLNPFSERAVLNDVNESNVHTFLTLDTWTAISLCVAGSVGKQEFMPCAGGESFSPCYHVERDLPYLICCSTKQFGGGFVPRLKGRVFEY